MVFALNPAQLWGIQPIDYATVEGRKIHEKATAPLVPKYDGSQKGLKMFLHTCQQKAASNGWTDTICKIPTGTGTSVVERNVMKEYGLVSIQECRTQAATFIGQENRKSQDSNNLKTFLDTSLDLEIMSRVLGRGNEYVILDAQGKSHEDGVTMLRVLISLVGINSKATVSVIRAALRALPAKMEEFNSNIVTFNEFVREQQFELRARGETVDDLPSSLYEAYQAAEDRVFAKYMADKESNVEDETIAVMNVEQILNTAESKYKTMVTKKQWNAVSKKEESFIAMKALFDSTMKKHADGRKAGTSNPTKNQAKHAWKNVAPTGSEPTTRTFEGKDWKYCPHGHMLKWVRAEGHEVCTKSPEYLAANPSKSAKTKKKPADSGTNAEKRKMLNAMIATLCGDDEDEEEDYEDENI